MIDSRGSRFAAALTSLVLAVVLVTGSWWLLAAQVLVFGVAVVAGPARSPYAQLFARFVRPRLSSVAQPESASPPRFAQTVGLIFASAGLAGFLSGQVVVGYAAVAAALAAAFLNATIGLCLGCELYLAARRISAAARLGFVNHSRPANSSVPTTTPEVHP
jgi:hypothetical protein